MRRTMPFAMRQLVLVLSALLLLQLHSQLLTVEAAIAHLELPVAVPIPVVVEAAVMITVVELLDFAVPVPLDFQTKIRNLVPYYQMTLSYSGTTAFYAAECHDGIKSK